MNEEEMSIWRDLSISKTEVNRLNQLTFLKVLIQHDVAHVLDVLDVLLLHHHDDVRDDLLLHPHEHQTVFQHCGWNFKFLELLNINRLNLFLHAIT